MKRALLAAAVVTIILSTTLPLWAHCQIPCGIYDDMMRIKVMREHITTIEKSIAMVEQLQGKTSAEDVNQMVRWVINKDEHADALAEIATAYFLQQRIKPPKGDDAVARTRYLAQLETLHEILVTGMKAKQTVDPEIPGKLRGLIDELARLYFSKEDLKLLQSGHEH